MVKTNLEYAVKLAKEVLSLPKEGLIEKTKTIAVEKNEIQLWENAAKNMNLPFDEEKQLTKQDDTFFDKTVWDFENTPKEKYPLLQHYHPLMIYRYQVNKQADVVLAQLLHSKTNFARTKNTGLPLL